jgi:biuret amidohydrolase
MDIDPTTTAVLAVHVQGDVVGPDGAFAGFFRDQVVKQNTLGAIASVLDTARAAGAPVIYLQVAFAPDYSDLVANCPLLETAQQMGALIDGAAQTEISADVAATEHDTVLKVKRVGGFTDSGLADLLKSRGINTVVLTGVATNLSVEGTARQASDLGYRTVLISDACSAADEATHAASLASMGLLGEIATSADFAAALKTPSTALA